MRKAWWFGLCLLIFFDAQICPAVTVSARSDITYTLSDAGGSASVTTFHFANLAQATNGELGLYTMGMRPTMFFGGSALYDDFIWADKTLINHSGMMSSSWFHQGACLLIEGTYSGRTIGGAGPRPIWFASGVGTSGNVILNCPPLFDDPDLCEEAITDTQTSIVSLSAVADGRGDELVPESLRYPLSRVESRGDETFIMDEWSVVSKGEVVLASSPEFAVAVAEQAVAWPQDAALVVQEPVHAANDRWIPKPMVRIQGGIGLPPENRGDGQLVLARLEFSPENVVDRWEVLYTSGSADVNEIGELLKGKLGLVFSSEKTHRTAAYVVFRLTDRLEVLDTLTALPQCCCGETICI